MNVEKDGVGSVYCLCWLGAEKTDADADGPSWACDEAWPKKGFDGERLRV